MSIPQTAAELPKPPTGTFQATFNNGPRFEGTVTDGLVPAALKEVKTTTSTKFPNKDGSPKVQLLWLFSVIGQEAAGELGFYTSFSTHEKSKLPGVLAAIKHPTPTPENPTINPVPFFGAKVNLFVKNKSGTDGKTFPKVLDVLPA